MHAMSDLTVVINLKTLTGTLLVYIVLVSVFALLGVTVLNWSESQHLAQSAVKTVGKVTAKEPDNHNFIRYAFEADHIWFHGVGHAGGENPPFDELEVGAPVIVYYDSENPDSSFLGNPKDQAASMTAGLIFITLVGPLLSMFGLCRKRWLPIFSKGAQRN